MTMTTNPDIRSLLGGVSFLDGQKDQHDPAPSPVGGSTRTPKKTLQRQNNERLIQSVLDGDTQAVASTAPLCSAAGLLPHDLLPGLNAVVSGGSGN